MKAPSIFLFAGEKSGDIHGEQLISSLKAKYPKARIFGVGGPHMRSQDFECVLPMEKFQVMGFIDVFFALPKMIYQLFFLRRTLLKQKPDIVLLIDYPGFNLALAKSLFNKSFPGKVCQYISPSVWAWGKSRIKKMEKILDHLFVIFPFEKELFDPKKLQAHYVGHPLVQKIQQVQMRQIEIDPQKRCIGIFPGSRRKELVRNFPLQIKVAKRLSQKFPDIFFLISVADPSFSPLLEEIMRSEGFRENKMLIEGKQNLSMMKNLTLAIAKSGTNNLELALHEIPTVVTYGIDPIDLFIAKNILRIRLPHYCIVNIIAHQTIFPELIGPHFTEEKLFAEASRFLSSEKSREECREKCREISKILEERNPAEEIVQVLFNEKTYP